MKDTRTSIGRQSKNIGLILIRGSLCGGMTTRNMLKTFASVTMAACICPVAMPKTAELAEAV